MVQLAILQVILLNVFTIKSQEYIYVSISSDLQFKWDKLYVILCILSFHENKDLRINSHRYLIYYIISDYFINTLGIPMYLSIVWNLKSF